MFSDKNIISVTDKAAERVKYLINKGDENVKGLRIGVKSSGCSGFKYSVEYAVEWDAAKSVSCLQYLPIIVGVSLNL